jgi:DNA-binding LytR/AlgR family response regulator
MTASDLRTVVVDDEPLAREELGYLLEQIDGIDIIGEAGNGIEAVATIERLRPDVVFLDVQMPGLTGFEVARRLLSTAVGSHIVFVTAFDRHAIEAFEVNAVDYLLKPVDPQRLEVAVQRARRRIAADRAPAGEAGGAAIDADALEKIVQAVAERQNRRERLAVKVGERFLLVQADDILYASLADESITVATGQ